jgi:hypothetical protein
VAGSWRSPTQPDVHARVARRVSEQGVPQFVNSRIGTFFRTLRHETDGTRESVRDRKSLLACNFRFEPDNHAVCRSHPKRTVAGLWYRGSRVRVPLATLESSLLSRICG